MNAQFEILEGLEIPKQQRDRGSKWEEQFSAMKRGQAFAIPIEGEDDKDAKKKAQQRQSALSGFASKTYREITTRFDKENSRLLVWFMGMKDDSDLESLFDEEEEGSE